MSKQYSLKGWLSSDIVLSLVSQHIREIVLATGDEMEWFDVGDDGFDLEVRSQSTNGMLDGFTYEATLHRDDEVGDLIDEMCELGIAAQVKEEDMADVFEAIESEDGGLSIMVTPGTEFDEFIRSHLRPVGDVVHLGTMDASADLALEVDAEFEEVEDDDESEGDGVYV